MARRAYDTFEDQRKAGRKRLLEGAQLIGDPPSKNHFRGGMYLMGYAIECALKSVIMSRLGVRILADAESAYAARFGESIRLTAGHDLEDLFEVAKAVGLQMPPGTNLLKARTVAFRWKVDWRYMHREPKQRGLDAVYFRDQVRILYDWLTSQI